VQKLGRIRATSATLQYFFAAFFNPPNLSRRAHALGDVRHRADFVGGRTASGCSVFTLSAAMSAFFGVYGDVVRLSFQFKPNGKLHPDRAPLCRSVAGHRAGGISIASTRRSPFDANALQSRA
jgi:hypothetical protein